MTKAWVILFFLSFPVFAINCPTFYCNDYNAVSLQRSSTAREYELNHKIIDEITSTDYFTVLKAKRSLGISNLYLIVDFPIHISGEYEEFYDSKDDFKHDKKVNYKSFREPSIHLEYWFKHSLASNFFHALDLSYTPKFYRPSVYQFGNGRHEVKINYHYLTVYKTFFVEGNIYSKVFGRKETILTDRSIEFTPAYTEVVTNFGVGYFSSRFLVSGLVGYGQTTNFSNKSKNLTHESDKGFVLQYLVTMQYQVKSDLVFRMEYEATSKIFNTINEDLSKDIDFENETSNLQLMLVRSF